MSGSELPLGGAASFDGVVLCGGASRRMGRDKALLVVDGHAMATRVAEALGAAGAREIVALGGDDAALSSLGLRVLADRRPGGGPLAAVVQSLTEVGDQPCVAVLGCDLVAPDPALIRSLVRAQQSSAADAVVPVADDRAQWVHAVWHRRCGSLLARILESGEASIRAAADALRVEWFEVPAHLVRDADRPEELPEGVDRMDIAYDRQRERP